MNNRMRYLLITVLACVCLLAACERGDKSAGMTPDALVAALEAGQALQLETPFVQRDFKTTLDGKWIGDAISYGCYREGQEPHVKGPSEAEILEDLNILKAYWNLIRVYGSDDDSERVLKVIHDNQLPFKVMLGIWLQGEKGDPEVRKGNISQIQRAIKLAKQYPDIVAAINVGNETQVYWSGHKLNAEHLIRYIRAVRANTSVPVTTADDYNFWNKPESQAVAAEVDFIVVHIYPLWNGKMLSNAISWLDETYKTIQGMHPDKQLVIGESGWATRYNPAVKGPGGQGTLIKGEVGLKGQEAYLLGLHEWVHKNKVTTFLFEAFDEPWKGGGAASGPDEVEKHWGVFYESRKPKESFQRYLKQIGR